MLSQLFARARAQSLVEYALIIAFVTLVVIGTVALFGPQLSNAFRSIANNL